jgi:ATP citrate (pro-S)-lyase
MPRKTISEFRAKSIVSTISEKEYTGWEINTELPLGPQLENVSGHGNTFVVKVDQAVKGRFKKGLVLLNIPTERIQKAIEELRDKGYRWVLVEPMVAHDQKDERYLSIARDRSGLQLYYSLIGGINVEENRDAIQEVLITDQTDWEALSGATGLPANQLRGFVTKFEQNHFVFMEINPYIVSSTGIRLLDLAVEVDDAGAYFVENWREKDIRTPHMQRSPEEETITQLAKKSPASFSFDLLNPDGGIFLLLSGGGASITIADEVYNQGFGSQLANYGEYSGNPNPEETYIYTAAVMRSLTKSNAPKKVLFIGGAVANFTDIVNTFKGVIRALDEYAPQLQEQAVKVFVRRGGPREEEGLKAMRLALERHDLLGAVYDASTPLAAVVSKVLKEIA